MNKNSGFAKGTLVHTNKGLVPIQELKVGDMVLSLSENGEGETAYKRVVNTFKSAEKKELMGGLFGIFCTDDHPFWEIGRGWVPFIQMHTYGKGAYTLTNANKNESPLRTDICGRGQVYEADGYNDMFDIGGLYLAHSGTEGVAVFYFSNNKDDYRAKEGGYLLVDFNKYPSHFIFTDDSESSLGYWQNQATYFVNIYHDILFSDKDPKCSYNLEKIEANRKIGVVLRKGRDDEQILKYSRILDDFDLHDRMYEYEHRDNRELIKDYYDRFAQAFSDYVYNIEVEDYHTYFVGKYGYWVHQ